MNIQEILKNLVFKFKVAFEGLFFGLLHDSSIQLQALLAVVVLGLIVFLPLQVWEMIVLLLLIGLVLALEYMNTSIEWICDALMPQEHADVKRIKDLASASVLVMSLFAAVIAIIILFPTIKELL